MFIREKQIVCGKDYVEVDIIPRTDLAERTVRGVRQKRENVSKPKQMNLNDKNAKRYFVQLGNGNFWEGDLHITCTYNEKYLPETIEEIEKEARNYIRRLSYAMKKKNLGELKYILVTEYKLDEKNGYIKRPHHHIVINKGLDRDEVENLWSKKKKKIGWVNADRIQVNENGIEALCMYLVKDPRGKKRWSSSRNLKRPRKKVNDYKYTKRKLEKLAMLNDNGKEQFEKIYKNHFISSVEAVYYEETGWHFYLKMWRKKGHVLC